jgi:hypothetical protein
MSDMPTRHLLLPQGIDPELGPQQPQSPIAQAARAMAGATLTPPQSWADDEGTAAILLPEDASVLSETTGRSQLQLSSSTKQTIRRQWLVNLGMGLGGAAVMLVVLGLGARLSQRDPTPTFSASEASARQQLMDDVVIAVRSGQLEQALGILQRLQGTHRDPAVDLMITSVKRQLASTGRP